MIGSVIKHYRVDSLIGEGGMGAVYRGTDLNLSRQVAIKLLHPQLLRDPGFRERFLSEATIQGRLNHPNIISVYDFDLEGGMIVMELVDGESLDDMIGSGPLPPALCLEIMRQVLAGIEFAHTYRDDLVPDGIVHRDLKPSNIIVARRGDALLAKIADFGIAKIAGDAKSRTATGAQMGTLHYMSPEQVKSARSVSRVTDIYSLGITLFEMATGRVPFDEQSEYDLMTRILETPVPALSGPSGHHPFDAIIARATAKAPGDRYQSAREFSSALSAAAGASQSGTMVSAATAAPTGMPRPTLVSQPGAPMRPSPQPVNPMPAQPPRQVMPPMPPRPMPPQPMPGQMMPGQMPAQAMPPRPPMPHQVMPPPYPGQWPAQPPRPSTANGGNKNIVVIGVAAVIVLLAATVVVLLMRGNGGNTLPAAAGMIAPATPPVASQPAAQPDPVPPSAPAPAPTNAAYGLMLPGSFNPPGSYPLGLSSNQVSASSYGESAGIYYYPWNVTDGVGDSCWAENVPGVGIGEWISFDLGRPVTLESFGIVAGYDKYKPDKYGDRFTLNARPASARLVLDNDESKYFLLNFADDRRMQYFSLPAGVSARQLRLVITQARYGTGKQQDMSISEIAIFGR